MTRDRNNHTISEQDIALLERLADGSIISRDEASRLWYGGPWQVANRNSFRVRICYLRKKVGLRGGELSYERGQGYRLDDPGQAIARLLVRQYRSATAALDAQRARKREFYRQNAESEKARSAAYRADPRNALFRKLRRNGIPLDVARAEVARAFAMEAAE